MSNRWYVWKFSSTLSYAYVACGRIAAAIQFSPSSQLHPIGSVNSSAGCFIAREAGAIVTDLEDNRPWQLGTRSFRSQQLPNCIRNFPILLPGVANFGEPDVSVLQTSEARD